MKLLIREHIEQFTRGENPLKALNIGKRAQIENWFKTWAPDAIYKIDDDLNIKVKTSLWFKSSSQVTFLPDNLRIERFLYIEGNKIISLPDNLHIEGFLDIEGSNITSLPDNLYVGGNLNIKRSKLIFLPDNLYVGANLFITNTKIISLPDDLYVKGKIFKDF